MSWAPTRWTEKEQRISANRGSSTGRGRRGPVCDKTLPPSSKLRLSRSRHTKTEPTHTKQHSMPPPCRVDTITMTLCRLDHRRSMKGRSRPEPQPTLKTHTHTQTDRATGIDRNTDTVHLLYAIGPYVRQPATTRHPALIRPMNKATKFTPDATAPEIIHCS